MAETTRRFQVVAADAVGERVSFAFAGKVSAIPSIVQPPPRPTTVRGLAGVAASPVSSSTRMIVAVLLVPRVVRAK